MKKCILFILIVVLSIVLFSCKKDGLKNKDLSRYELQEIDSQVYENESYNDLSFSSLFVKKEKQVNYLAIEFQIEDEYYGYPEIHGDIAELMSKGYINENTFASPEEKIASTASLFQLNYASSGVVADIGLVESIKKLSNEELQGQNSAQSIYHFYKLINPKNIITNETYDFSIINYEFFSGFGSVINTNIDSNKCIICLNQYYIGEAIKLKKPLYLAAEKYPVVSIVNEEAFLIRSSVREVKTTPYDKLSYEYDENLISRNYRNIDGEYPLCNIIKKYTRETDFYTSIAKSNGDIYFSTNTKYVSMTYEAFLRAITNYENDLLYFYNEISEDDFNSVTFDDKNGLSQLLVNDISQKEIKFDNNTSAYNIDLNGDEYFLAKCENDGNYKYYKFNSINNCDLNNVIKIYYIRSGVITKDLINNIDYSIKVSYVVDVTKLNTNGYRIPANKYYIKEFFNYSYDGLLLITSKSEIESIIDKENLVLGKDITHQALYDLKSNERNVIFRNIDLAKTDLNSIFSSCTVLDEITLHGISYLIDDKLDSEKQIIKLYSVRIDDVLNYLK